MEDECPYWRIVCKTCPFIWGSILLKDGEKYYDNCGRITMIKNNPAMKELTIHYGGGCIFLQHQSEEPWWEKKKKQLEELGHTVKLIRRLRY